MADTSLHIGLDGRELVGRTTGVGRYLHQIIAEWLATGVRHRLTAFVPSKPPDAMTATLPGVHWDVHPDTKGGTVWEQTRLPRAMRAAKIDVFFASGYTAPLARACPFVVAIYDVSFFAHPEWFRPRERMRRRLLTRLAAQRAHSVVTISEFSAAEIERWLGIGRDRIRLAPPGPPATIPSRTDRRREPIVLFVGSLFNRRHIPELVRGFALAARAVSGARLLLVGDNRTHPHIDPLSLAHEAGAGQIEWRQYVDDAELARLYDSARVFAFLSDYEGFGMTPMEAIAHGVPAVLQDTAVTREVYGSGARVIPPTPEAIAEALTELLTDDVAHRNLIDAGRRRLAELSWTRSAATILAALEDAARTR